MTSYLVLQASSTALNMERRVAFGQIAAGAAVVAGLPSLAVADGAVSKATIARSRGIYGDRIAALEKAVNAGDFKAVAEAKNSFVLFNSGAYPLVKDKSAKAAAIKGTNDIFAAIRSGDKGALKSAYTAYVKANEIKPLPAINSQQGQGYSGDFDYKTRTSAGAIYVR